MRYNKFNKRRASAKMPPATAFPLHFSTQNFMFLSTKLTLTCVSHTGCQQTAGQMCFDPITQFETYFSGRAEAHPSPCLFTSLGGEKQHMPWPWLSTELGCGQGADQRGGNLKQLLNPSLLHHHFFPER